VEKRRRERERVGHRLSKGKILWEWNLFHALLALPTVDCRRELGDRRAIE